ncbi:MAG: Lrp/AsnC family transcriptional regulator [Candidatus Odinarchaeia archaeon]
MKIDEKDKIILEMLKKNARTPLKDIAKKLGLSIPSVSFRIKELIKNKIIRGFHASIDYEKLGEACQLVLQIRLSQKYNTDKIGKILSKLEKTA